MDVYHHRSRRPRPASPKQLAYLLYMGVAHSTDLGYAEAEALIHRLEKTASYEEWQKLVEKKCTWRIDRFILHPSLFLHEFQVFYHQELPEILCEHLRNHLPQLREWPTLAKVHDCLLDLARERPNWWQQPGIREQFLAYYMVWRTRSRPSRLAITWQHLQNAAAFLKPQKLAGSCL